MLDNLPKAAVIVPAVPALWHYDRDTDDAHYINLALAAGATLVVSRDRDLLDLMDLAKSQAAIFQAQFPDLRILDPVQFLQQVDSK